MDLYKIDIDNNLIKITKKYEYYLPIVYGIKNNKKIKLLNFNIINNILSVLNDNFDEIYISDNNTFESFILKQNIEIYKEKISLTTSYLKGKVSLHLLFDKKYNYEKSISVSGDLNKNIYLPKNCDKLTINFVHQIFGFANLNININNEPYNIDVIDLEKFPKNIIKTNSGIKLNESSIYDLTLTTNIGDFFIKSGNNELVLDMDNIDYIKLFYKKTLIIEHNIIKKFLPILTIVFNPLRLILSQRVLFDVKVNINNNYYVIKQGNIEKELNIKGTFKILNVENCIFKGEKTVFNI